LEYASDFINMGKTALQRQAYLSGACSAWNIAVMPEHLREDALKKHAEVFNRINPGVNDEEGFLHDMRLLIQRKLELFPKVNVIIMDARIKPINDSNYQVQIASMDKHDYLLRLAT